MTTFRLRKGSARSILAVILGLIVLLVYSGGVAVPASAAPVQAVPAQTVTIPAGGSASLQVRGFGMQPGAAAPQGALALAQPSLPSDRVRVTLYYGIDWGYTETNPDQVAEAIWYAQTGTWQSQDHAIAERIANAAAGAPGLPFWNVDGQSLLTLATQGQVTLSTLTLTSGQGTVTLTNTTGQDITAYLPYGTLFSGSAGSAVVWATGAGQVQQPTATTLASSPTVAATETPTQAAEATATATPTMSGVPVKPGTTPPVKSTETATASPTDVPAVSNPTETATTQPAPPTATATQAGSQNMDPPAMESPTQPPVVKGGTAGSGSGSAPTSTAPPAAPTQSKPAATATNAPQPQAPLASAANSNSAAQHASNPAPRAPQQQDAEVKKQSEVPAVKAIVQDAAPAPPPPSAPSPVSTASGQTTGAPPPVVTGQPQVPNPQLTQVATLPPGKVPTFTPALKPTFTPSPTVASIPNPGGDTAKPTPTPLQKPPVPVPTPLPPGPGPSTDPTIIVSGDSSPPASDGGAPTKAPVPPVQSGVGSPPTNNPNTGGGQSTLPAWLSALSAMMLAGGWLLRKMSGTPLPVTAEAEDEAERTPETLN